jgi:hypothetical protein
MLVVTGLQLAVGQIPYLTKKNIKYLEIEESNKLNALNIIDIYHSRL